jgi:hypothetical protein
MTRERQAAECGRGGERAEQHCARGPGLQWVVDPHAPVHHEVDVEGDTHAQQQRQGDDVREIERQVRKHAGRDRQQSGEKQRRHDEENIVEAPQHEGERSR